MTDQDFGEFYLRRRIVPDFIYDAARLFNLVLIGYSANDAPMRYLLNAVAADGSRFDDLKTRFSFVPVDETGESVTLADWRGRGIVPIPYHKSNSHQVLKDTLDAWAEISPHNGKPDKIDSLLRRLVAKPPNAMGQSTSDLFEHLYRRGNDAERLHILDVITKAAAHHGWLDIAMDVDDED